MTSSEDSFGVTWSYSFHILIIPGLLVVIFLWFSNGLSTSNSINHVIFGNGLMVHQNYKADLLSDFKIVWWTPLRHLKPEIPGGGGNDVLLFCCVGKDEYLQTSNISRTLGNKIVDHSDVLRASPVGAAPTTSSFSTEHLASIDCVKTAAGRGEKNWNFGVWCHLY